MLLYPIVVSDKSSPFHFASSFDDAICVILGFIETGWHSAHEFSGATQNEVVKLFAEFEMHESITHGLADTLLEVANKICNDHAGLVPQSKEDLKSIGLKEPLVSLFMQHVYASSELVITLDTRKVVVALDMVDWEEFGAKTKSAVLMGKVNEGKVRRSLRTWLPKGDGVHFHDTMDSIGRLVSARTIGDWGKIEKIIASHFSTKDKEALIGMLQSIHQFSKVTRAKGGKKKRG